MQKPEAYSGYAEVNGARLYYEVAGSGHGLVLLHAGIADSRMWDDQFTVLAERYRVVRYDQRGFGRSSVPPGPFSWYGDLAELMRQLDIPRAALVGASLGGAAALDLAIAHPELVGALVLVGSGLNAIQGAYSTEEDELFAQVEAAALAGDFETANDLEVHLWVDGPARDPEAVASGVRERIREMNLPTFLRHDELERAEPRDVDPPAGTRLAEVRAPTLVVVGEQDLSGIQNFGEKLAAEIPGAHKVSVADAAHVPNMERPELFNRLVVQFLASVGW